MHSVLIRGASLEASPVYRNLSASRQILFLHLLCLVDGFGCCRAELAYVKRAALVDTNRITDANLAGMLDALAAGGLAALICRYEHEGRPYLWIPHYRQRLERTKLTCPIPPLELLERDPDAVRKFRQVAHLHPRATVPAAPAGGQVQRELPMTRRLAPVPPPAPPAPPLEAPDRAAQLAQALRLTRDAKETPEAFGLRVAQRLRVQKLEQRAGEAWSQYLARASGVTAAYRRGKHPQSR